MEPYRLQEVAPSRTRHWLLNAAMKYNSPQWMQDHALRKAKSKLVSDALCYRYLVDDV